MYELCEFYYFRHPALKLGFRHARGELLQDAAEYYPKAWDYLQTCEGQKLCVTEEEWQAMTRAVWHTNADGSKIGWDGVGGAPFYVQDLNTGTLRLPDLRGMYAEAAGFDGLEVGGVHGDAIRPIVGSAPTYGYPATASSGALLASLANNRTANVGTGAGYGKMNLDTSRVVPTAAKNQPRAWGALACVYLGLPGE